MCKTYSLSKNTFWVYYNNMSGHSTYFSFLKNNITMGRIFLKLVSLTMEFWSPREGSQDQHYSNWNTDSQERDSPSHIQALVRRARISCLSAVGNHVSARLLPPWKSFSVIERMHMSTLEMPPTAQKYCQ